MKTEIVKDPPERCPFCNAKRFGIAEGVIYFLCGTTKIGEEFQVKCQHG